MLVFARLFVQFRSDYFGGSCALIRNRVVFRFISRVCFVFVLLRCISVLVLIIALVALFLSSVFSCFRSCFRRAVLVFGLIFLFSFFFCVFSPCFHLASVFVHVCNSTMIRAIYSSLNACVGLHVSTKTICDTTTAEAIGSVIG